MRLRGFLGVLGTFVFSACVVSTHDGERTSPIPIPGSGGSAGTAGTAAGGSAGSAGASGSGGTAGSSSDSGTDASSSDSGDAEIDSPADGTDGTTTDTGTTDSASPDSGTTDGGCNDSVGGSVDCSGVNPDLTCSVVGTPYQKSYCERAPTLFKPRVAERVSRCIAGLSPLELCAPPLVAQCITDGLSSACSDTTVSVQCSAIVSACPAIALAQCQLYLAGMTATARARMVSCMSAGCNLATCVRDL